MFAHGETVTVLTAGTVTDPYSGQPTPSWATSTSLAVPGVGVEPRPSSEPVQDARNAVTSGYTLYFPAGTALTAQHRVVVRGGTYDILGEPAVWVSPFSGWAPGIVVQTQIVSG